MKPSSANRKPQRLLLIGAGETHLRVLSHWAKNERLPHLEIVLINPTCDVYYLGMLPGLIAGTYRQDQLKINIETLANRVGASFRAQTCVGIDPIAQEVILSQDGQLFYDYVSFDLASQNQKPLGWQNDNWRLAEIANVEALEAKITRWHQQFMKGDLRLAVIGAAGFEVLMALRERFPKAKLVFFGGREKFAPSFLRAMEGAEIKLLPNLVERMEVSQSSLTLFGDGQAFSLDAAFLATPNIPDPIFADADLAGPRGNLEVIASLNSPIFSNIFGAGQSIDFRPSPGARFGEREADVLFFNLWLSVQGRYDWKKIKAAFFPIQSIYVAKNDGIFTCGPIAWRSSWLAGLRTKRELTFMRLVAGQKPIA